MKKKESTSVDDAVDIVSIKELSTVARYRLMLCYMRVVSSIMIRWVIIYYPTSACVVSSTKGILPLVQSGLHPGS